MLSHLTFVSSSGFPKAPEKRSHQEKQGTQLRLWALELGLNNKGKVPQAGKPCGAYSSDSEEKFVRSLKPEVNTMCRLNGVRRRCAT